MHRTRRTLLASLLVAVAVSLGFALSGVPNIELVTVTVFISGFLLGPAIGAGVGAVAAVLFSTFNPLGAALPPLVAAQALGQAIAGLSGAVAGPMIVHRRRRLMAAVAAGGTGFVITVLYDVLTNAGAWATMAGESSFDALVKFIVAGTLLAGVHVVWNTMVFAVVLAPSLRVLEAYRRELTTR